jgi:sensor c-di-GMP phosphodiesterase-like protein
MLNEHHDHTIVTTIIGMARNLGLKAIAEGRNSGAGNKLARARLRSRTGILLWSP